MDNLPLRTILTFISAKIPELDQTILSHQGYGYVFLNQADLDSLSDHFILYRNIRAWYRDKLDYGYLDLSSLATKHPRPPKWTASEIRRHIGTVIDNACQLTAEEEVRCSPLVYIHCPGVFAVLSTAHGLVAVKYLCCYYRQELWF